MESTVRTQLTYSLRYFQLRNECPPDRQRETLSFTCRYYQQNCFFEVERRLCVERPVPADDALLKA